MPERIPPPQLNDCISYAQYAEAYQKYITQDWTSQQIALHEVGKTLQPRIGGTTLYDTLTDVLQQSQHIATLEVKEGEEHLTAAEVLHGIVTSWIYYTALDHGWEGYEPERISQRIRNYHRERVTAEIIRTHSLLTDTFEQIASSNEQSDIASLARNESMLLRAKA